MKLKMMQHDGAMVLMVSGAQQQLIITEEDGCFVVEMVTVPALAPVHVQEESCPVVPAVPPVLAVVENALPQDNAMFDKLVALRKSLATTDNVPPYLIFHNKTLREMCEKMPTDIHAMGNIPGVGQAKLDKYGQAFLDAINAA